MTEDEEVAKAIEEAPTRKVFYIDVGNMKPTEAEAYLREVKKKMIEAKIDG